MTNPTIAKRYYPRLSEVVAMDDLPEYLSLIKNGLTNVFDKVHYKNLQYSKSPNGESAFYSLDIVTAKRLGITIPGGLELLLNPDVDNDTTISSFPVSLQYKWEILAFIRAFKLSNFSYSPLDIFQLGLKLFKLTDAEVLAHTINHFVEPVDENTSKLQQLVNDVNTVYGSTISLAPETDTIEETIALIEADPKVTDSVAPTMFATYILDTDTVEMKRKLEKFYNIIIPRSRKSAVWFAAAGTCECK